MTGKDHGYDSGRHAFPTNSAGRLIRIIHKMRLVDDTETIKNGWCQILDVPSCDPPTLFRRLGLVLVLPEQVANDMQKVTDPHNLQLHLKWIPDVNTILGNLSLGSRWTAMSRVSNDHLDWILACEALIQNGQVSMPLSEAQVDSLMKDIADLRQHVDDSGLGRMHKVFVNRQLELIDRAIVEFFLGGPVIVERVTNEVVGSMGIEAMGNAKSPSKTYFKKLWGILAQLNAITQAPESMRKIGSVAKSATTWLMGSDGG